MTADRFERTSPKALIPKQLIAMTKKIKIETQAAELISAFQNLQGVATNPRGEPAFRWIVMERSIHVPDDKRPSDDLVGRDDQVLAEVDDGSSETESRVDESSGMTAMKRARRGSNQWRSWGTNKVSAMLLTRNLSWKGTWSTFLPRPT